MAASDANEGTVRVHPFHRENAGWFNMICWNGLSAEQQQRLIEQGNLPINYVPEGWCKNGAELCIETMYDESEGPRFYCFRCGLIGMARVITLKERAEGAT